MELAAVPPHSGFSLSDDDRVVGWGFGRPAALMMACGCCNAGAQERPPQEAFACGGATIAGGTANRAIDGRIFTLDDSREVRLVGIEVPPFAPAEDSQAVPGGVAARDALAGLLAGAEIVLKQAEPQQTDRYGCLVAYGFTTHYGIDHSVQAGLIAAGYARVAARAGSRACAAELLTREGAARTAKLGLWASSYYDSLDADNPADVPAEQGRFALVEG
jgi:endonuclease YncB( thermonuclease family)